MPRIRSIHPDACRSRKLASVTAEAERCYWRLQPHCDDEGRVEDEPDILASVMFQVQRSILPEMVDGWLWDLHDAELIDRYEVKGAYYIEVRRWSDYQHPQRKKKSDIPPAPGPGSRTGTRRARDGSVSGIDPIADGGEWSGGETDIGAEGESEGEPERPCRPVDSAEARSLQQQYEQLGRRYDLTPPEEPQALSVAVVAAGQWRAHGWVG